MWVAMAGQWWRNRRCGAKTRKGKRCVAKAMPNGRCRNHGGMCTGPEHRGRQAAPGGSNAHLVGNVGPKGAQQVMNAVAFGQIDKMRRIRKAELARQQREGL